MDHNLRNLDKTHYVSNIIYLTLFIIMTHVQIVTHLMREILTLLALVVRGIPQWSIYSSRLGYWRVHEIHYWYQI